MRDALALPFVFVGLCGFTTMHAASGTDAMSWSSASLTLTVDPSGVAAMTDDAVLEAVRGAFAAWNAVECSRFRFVDGGTSQSATTFGVRFIHDADAWAALGGAVDDAVAYTKLVPSGTSWSNVVIYLADYGDIVWGSTGDLREHDLQSVITHELGHALGLQHSADPRATMYYRSSDGVTYLRTLAEDDIAGVCYLYPNDSRTCASDADCPLIDNPYGGSRLAYVCDSSACVSGQRGYGEDCFVNGNCSGNLCVRFDDSSSSNPGVCTQSCPCPGDDVCADGYCAPRAAACADGCTGNHLCTQDIDGDFGCLATCLEDSHCDASNAICFGAIDGANAGVCRVPGARDNALACSDASECASLICTVNTNGESLCIGTLLAEPTEVASPSDDLPETPDATEEPEAVGPDGVDSTDTSNPVTGGCAAEDPCQIVTPVALFFLLLRSSWRKRIERSTVLTRA